MLAALGSWARSRSARTSAFARRSAERARRVWVSSRAVTMETSSLAQSRFPCLRVFTERTGRTRPRFGALAGPLTECPADRPRWATAQGPWCRRADYQVAVRATAGRPYPHRSRPFPRWCFGFVPHRQARAGPARLQWRRRRRPRLLGRFHAAFPPAAPAAILPRPAKRSAAGEGAAKPRGQGQGVRVPKCPQG